MYQVHQPYTPQGSEYLLVRQQIAQLVAPIPAADYPAGSPYSSSWGHTLCQWEQLCDDDIQHERGAIGARVFLNRYRVHE